VAVSKATGDRLWKVEKPSIPMIGGGLWVVKEAHRALDSQEIGSLYSPAYRSRLEYLRPEQPLRALSWHTNWNRISRIMVVAC